MQVKYLNVLVDRSETAKIPVSIPAWELPVLRYVNPVDCAVKGEFFTEIDDHDFTDPGREYDRLVGKYVADTDTGKAAVAEVYGVGEMGRAALAKAIEAATESAPPAGDELEDHEDPLVALGLKPAPVKQAAPEGATQIDA